MGGFRADDPPGLPERVTPLAVVAVGVALRRPDPEGHPGDPAAGRDRRPLDELLDVATDVA
jgi:hypothetical protein